MKKASKVFVLIFLTLVISLAACSSDSNSNGSDDENAGEVTTIYMAALENDPNGIIEKSRQEFNEAHDDIQVEFIKLSNNASEAHDQMVTQLAGGSKNLDIVNLDIVWIAEFAEAGWLLPLDDLFTEEMQSEFINRQVEAMRYNDHIWAVPWLNDVHPLWYRTDLLEKYDLDVPETYEEAVEVAKMIQEEEGIPHGFTMHWGRAEQLIVSFSEFLHANNGRFFDEEGNVTINEPEAVEALQFMVDMIYEHEVVAQSALGNSVPDDPRIPFTEGQALFNSNWGYVYALNQADDSAVKDKTWLADNPKFEGGNHANSLGGWKYGIANSSEHPKEAWEVIKWFTSYDIQKQSTLNGQIATRKDVLEDADVIEQYPFVEEYVKTAENAVARPIHPRYNKLSDLTQSKVHAALTKEMTPQEALDELASELESLD